MAGMPGSGKTTLSRALVQAELHKAVPGRGDVPSLRPLRARLPARPVQGSRGARPG
ncbi:hypothetical protein ACU686_12725 [Yinghuangia aomiensis]